jgi:hypothetical protein
MLLAWVTKMRPPYWTVETRSVAVSVGFLGFFIGRLLAGFQNPFDETLTGSKKKDLSKKQLAMFMDELEKVKSLTGE